VVGLGDGGAHCGVICDASTPTYLLTHWVRDRVRGPRVPIERVVARQTRETARLYGLDDRGQLAPGLLADVNVIDLDALTLAAPEMIYDLPANGRRLVQRVRGYEATVKRGVVTYEGGEATGALPGRLVRGPQPAAQGLRVTPTAAS
jgi:N-acyl-D-aspartate/D-glutamate deacylase